MSSNLSTREACAFHHALNIPNDVWVALRDNEASTNVVLSFAEKARSFPRNGDGDHLWIALYSGGDIAKNVEFVLSCTKGPLGNYPIFVVASRAAAQRAQEDRHDEDLADALQPLIRCLLDEVPAQRVFSVFSLAKVTRKFAEIFVAEARARQVDDIEMHEDPYYDATFTFCTGETLNRSPNFTFARGESEDVVITLCPADMSHLGGLAALCRDFSEAPYKLDDERAELEARTMIERGQVWVHLVQRNGQEPEVACLVAATRESTNVMAVTKVFTAKHWRGNRCSERLLHRFCQEVFRQRHRVVLYVGNTDKLAPARNVYRKVGFQGLGTQQGSPPMEGVEKWLEIGFKGTTIGYW